MFKRSGPVLFAIVLAVFLGAGCKPSAPPGAVEQGSSPEARGAAKPTPTKAPPKPQQMAQQKPARPAQPVGEVPTPPDVAGPPGDAEKTASGLASKVIEPGTGKAHPSAQSVVEVHYSGWTTDGKMFDSSHKRGRPAKFPLNRVIPGWTEGVQLMVEGEKRRFWIPEDLAYKGRPGAPQGMLVFDVELLHIDS